MRDGCNFDISKCFADGKPLIIDGSHIADVAEICRNRSSSRYVPSKTKLGAYHKPILRQRFNVKEICIRLRLVAVEPVAPSGAAGG